MSVPNRPTVNILSSVEGGDDCPQFCRSLAIALTQLGWQANLFVLVDEPVAHLSGVAPYCREVHLSCEGAVATCAEAIETAQRKRDLVWPLIHSVGAAATDVAAYLQAEQGWRWLHTPAAMDKLTNLQADQLISLRQWPAASGTATDWQPMAQQLDALYRRHLAVHVGATKITLPAAIALPLSPSAQTTQSPIVVQSA